MTTAGITRIVPLIALVALALVAVAPAAARTDAAVPQRIVSLSPTATENLFAVGAGKQVIAVDSLSTYPKQAPTTKISAYSPNAEAIAAYKPDLVVLSNDQNKIVSQLETLGVKTLLLPAPANIAGSYAEILQLGKVTGHTSEAAKVVATMKADITRIVKTTPRPATPLTVYHELDQTLYSVTSNTFIGQVYKTLGIRNIADQANAGNYPKLSAEFIVSSNPDLIVLADTKCCGQNVNTLASRPGWANITAVKKRSIAVIDDSVASEWGPRLVQFYKAVAAAVKKRESAG
jgi:iron complex transport system substrate-binding protein